MAGFQQYQINAIERKIERLPTYSQSIRGSKHHELSKRISDLILLGVSESKIRVLEQQLKKKYNAIIGDGSGAGSSS